MSESSYASLLAATCLPHPVFKRRPQGRSLSGPYGRALQQSITTTSSGFFHYQPPPALFSTSLLQDDRNVRLGRPQDRSSTFLSRILSHQGPRSSSDPRCIPSAPLRTLDAPELQGDPELNLFDLSFNNRIAVALDDALFLWSPPAIGGLSSTEPGLCTELSTLCDSQFTEENSYPKKYTAVRWSVDGRRLAVASGARGVQLWEVGDTRSRVLRTLSATHAGRVGGLCWNGPVLSTGSADGEVHFHDVRARSHLIGMCKGIGSGEICSLEWNSSSNLLGLGTSGGSAYIVDERRMDVSTRLFETSAAVNALAWCPWERGVLGFGSGDGFVRIFDTSENDEVWAFDTKGGEITGLNWSGGGLERELATGHGDGLREGDLTNRLTNRVAIWKFTDNELENVGALEPHHGRVIGMRQSADFGTIVTAGTDETLKFWEVFTAAESEEEGEPVLSAELRSESGRREDVPLGMRGIR